MQDVQTQFELDGDGPLYRQIKRAISTPILSGQVRPGTRLPTEQAFVEMFGASRMTVNRALRMLADDGLVTRHRRNGTFVAPQVAEHSVMELRDIADEIAETGANYTYELLNRRNARVTAHIAVQLGLRPGNRALFLKCRHLADGQPYVIEERHINSDAVPNIAAARFEVTPPSGWLLQNVPWSRAEHVVLAAVADDEMASLLALEPGDACLCIERTTWLGERPITFVRLTFPGSRHRLFGRFTPGR